MITADHGNDRSTCGTGPTREFIPLLVFGKSLSGHGQFLSDTLQISQYVAENFGVDKAMIGESFLDKLI